MTCLGTFQSIQGTFNVAIYCVGLIVIAEIVQTISGKDNNGPCS